MSKYKLLKEIEFVDGFLYWNDSKTKTEFFIYSKENASCLVCAVRSDDEISDYANDLQDAFNIICNIHDFFIECL